MLIYKYIHSFDPVREIANIPAANSLTGLIMLNLNNDRKGYYAEVKNSFNFSKVHNSQLEVAG